MIIAIRLDLDVHIDFHRLTRGRNVNGRRRLVARNRGDAIEVEVLAAQVVLLAWPQISLFADSVWGDGLRVRRSRRHAYCHERHGDDQESPDITYLSEKLLHVFNTSE